LDDRQTLVEGVVVAVVGVGQVETWLVEEIAQQDDLGAAATQTRAYVAAVLAGHDQDHVLGVEVGGVGVGGGRPRPAQTRPVQRPARARVHPLADVPPGGPGAGDDDRPAQVLVGVDQVAQDDLGHRGPADVPRAHRRDPGHAEGVVAGHIVNWFLWSLRLTCRPRRRDGTITPYRKEGDAMPLSEHEQRVLAELEDSLSKQDPRFAKSVRETNVYAHGGRRVRWGVLGFVVGLAVLVLTFSYNVALGLVGVALMFVSAVVIERNARLLGRASWQDLTRSAHGDDTPANVGPRTRSLRDWLSRQRRKSG